MLVDGAFAEAIDGDDHIILDFVQRNGISVRVAFRRQRSPHLFLPHRPILDAAARLANRLRIERHHLPHVVRHVRGHRQAQLFGLGGRDWIIMRPPSP